jgi:hypothetical protein
VKYVQVEEKKSWILGRVEMYESKRGVAMMPSANGAWSGRDRLINRQRSTYLPQALSLRGIGGRVMMSEKPLPRACAAGWAMTKARNVREAGSRSGGLGQATGLSSKSVLVEK